MNQQQRKYLVDKLNSEIKSKIQALNAAKPMRPNFSAFLLGEIREGRFDVKFADEIKQSLIDRAKAVTLGNNEKAVEFLKAGRKQAFSRYGEEEDVDLIAFPVRDILEFSDEYDKKLAAWKEVADAIDDAIKDLENQRNGMEMRIQLASPKTLEPLIDDIDRIGAMDLKSLTITTTDDVAKLMGQIEIKLLK